MTFVIQTFLMDNMGIEILTILLFKIPPVKDTHEKTCTDLSFNVNKYKVKRDEQIKIRPISLSASSQTQTSLLLQVNVSEKNFILPSTLSQKI